MIDINDLKEVNSNNALDLDSLRLSQNFSEVVGVKKRIVTVPVHKPNPQDFVRVHPDESMRLNTAVLELKEERETYLVGSELWTELPNELVPKILLATINRQGVLSLWPIRLPGEDGRIDTWNESAFRAAQLAQKAWVRVKSNMSLGAYEVFEAPGGFSDPEWPDLDFQQILEIAFRDRFINEWDHSVLKKLRGEL